MKFIILENKNQGLEYLKNIDNFKGVTPITFNFETEELLSEHNINFKIGESYGNHSVYKNTHKDSIRLTKEICKKININYRGIDLFQLFYADLILFFIDSLTHLKILKQIKKEEKIKEMIFFKNTASDFNNVIHVRIGMSLFEENVKIINYKDVNKKKKEKFLKFIGYFQNIISKIKLSLVKEEENKIFFCGNKNVFGNVIKELNKNKKNKIFRCSNSLQKSFFINKKYVPFFQLLGLKTKHKKKLIKDIKNFQKETISLRFLDDLSLEKELIPILKEWIFYYLEVKFLEISKIINQMIKLIIKKKINLIILYADFNNFEKTFAQIGNLFNIPSIVVQHGIIGNETGFMPKSADYLLAFGERSKKRLIDFGYPKKNIILTGSPQFDKYKDLNIKIKTNKQKKIVFIMGDSNNPEREISKEKWKIVYEMMFKALKKFPEYELIIKCKGEGDLYTLPEFIAKKENFQNMSNIININPIDLISDAEMVIITNSTMIFDALLLNKPVISINFKEFEKFFCYKDLKSVQTVHNQKELEEAIIKNKIQTKEDLLEIKKTLKEELSNLNGKASKRVVDVINNILYNHEN